MNATSEYCPLPEFKIPVDIENQFQEAIRLQQKGALSADEYHYIKSVSIFLEEKLVKEQYDRFNSVHGDSFIFSQVIDGKMEYFFQAKCEELMTAIANEEFPQIEIFEQNGHVAMWFARVVGIILTNCVRLHFVHHDNAPLDATDFPANTKPYKIRFLYPRFVYRSQHFALKRMRELQLYPVLIENPQYKCAPRPSTSFT